MGWENMMWYQGILSGGKMVYGLTEEQANALERQDKAEQLKRDSQASIDKSKQQIQSKNTSAQVADTLSGLTVNTPQPDGTTTQEPAKPSNLEQLNRMSMQRAGTAPMSVLRPDSQDPNIRQTAQNLGETSRTAQMSNQDIYSENQLTDKYSQIPEVQSYLANQNKNALNKGISDIGSGLSSGKYGQQGTENFDVTKLSGDFTKALSEAGISDEAVNSIQDIIKNETKKSTGLGFTTQQKRDDWNKIAAMPDGPDKDKAIDDYMMVYAPGTKYPLTDKGIGEATTKAGATAGASSAGGVKGKEGAEQEILTNTTIPGLKPIQGVRITEESIASIKKIQPDVETMLQLSDELIKKYNKLGSVFTGNDAADYSSKVRNLQLLAKSPSLYNLGVLTGPDLKLLEESIPNPASIKEGAKKQVLGDLSVKLNNFRDLIKTRANSYYRTNGFEIEQKKSDPTKSSSGGMGKTSPTEALGNVSQAKIDLANQALNDPQATPSEKAQAMMILRNAGVQ